MNAVSIVLVVLWLCPHLETKAEQQLSVVMCLTFCIGFVSSDCSKMSQGGNSLWYIILNILGICVAYTEHSNSHCKMHTLVFQTKGVAECKCFARFKVGYISSKNKLVTPPEVCGQVKRLLVM